MGDLGEITAVEMSEIGPENWAEAEKIADEIIRKLLPNSASEVRRRQVVDYVQRLIRERVGAEVLPYGSVPLKTYLPEGDIDLTVFGGRNVEEKMADDMKAVLEEEEKKTDADFVIKDVQLIRAEVKIVKCIIQNIVVDISLNQLGGLSTLCFLEQVDNLIGKDHLFKRSIILIKAWCYYESRILGAHHGLIATYALEILVLYIFHLFRSRLHGPLSVLYKFLEYFSKFDWDNYCVSINGPVPLSSLPLVVAEMPEDSDENLLLSSEFLSSCIRKYSVPSREGDKNARGFQPKHLNIVDPMKDSNNLGRSVSRGNFYRIRSAFSFGARKLAQILLLPEDSISDEIHKFFANTNPFNKGRQLPDGFSRQLISQFPIGETTLGKTDDLSGRYDEYNEATEGSTSAFKGLTLSDDSYTNQTQIRPHESTGSFENPIFAPHLHFVKSKSNEREFNISPRPDEEGRGTNIGIEKDGSLNNSFSVLTGDYETYSKHLQYGRQCFQSSISAHSLSNPNPPFPPVVARQVTNQLSSHVPVLRVEQNEVVSYMNNNGVYIDPALYSTQHMMIPNTNFGWEELPKPRGTGTYLPNMIHPPQGYMSSSSSRRNRAPSGSYHSNGITMFASETDTYHRSNNEASAPQLQLPINKNATTSSSGAFPSFSPQTNGYHVASGFDAQHNIEMPNSGKSRQQRKRISSPSKTSSREQDNRISLKSSYQLKDEEDFPPLSF